LRAAFKYNNRLLNSVNESMKIEPRTMAEIDFVEEDLFVGRNSTIKAKTGETIVVKGDLEFEGDCNILSSLHANNLILKNGGRINVNGDLTAERSISLEDGKPIVSGRLEADNVDIGKVVKVGKGLKCRNIVVGGVLESGGDTDAEKKA